MNQIVLENDTYIYRTADVDKVIFNLKDFSSNKSCIPLDAEGDAFSLHKLLSILVNGHVDISMGTDEGAYVTDYLIMDMLFTTEFMKKTTPVSVLEIGCGNGILSHHLASIIGCMDSDSHLCCECNTMGNGSGNQWLDKISGVAVELKLSYVVADYEESLLQANKYDYIFVNGSTGFEQPEAVLMEAVRLLKPGGRIYCYVKKQPVLGQHFKKLFPVGELYYIYDDSVVMTAVYDKNVYTAILERAASFESLGERAEKLIDEWNQVATSEVEESRLLKYISDADKLIDEAIKEKNTECKLRLIDIKEKMIERLEIK